MANDLASIPVPIVVLFVVLIACVAILAVRDHDNKRAIESLQRQYRIIGAIGETFSSIFLVHLEDLSLDVIKISPSLERIHKDHPDLLDFLIHVLCELVVPESREAAEATVDLMTFDERLRGRPFLATDVEVIDGTWYSVQVIPQHRDDSGKLIGVIVALRDVTKLKRAEELSYTDKLTGLRNRNYLEACGENLIHPGDYPASLIMADCNYLKRTNDTLGHEMGDELLRRVSKVLRDMAGFDRQVIRLGGDEFLIVCPHTDELSAAAIVDRIHRGLTRASDHTLTLSVSVGTVTVNDPATSIQQALDAADKAMYAEKKAAHEAAEAAETDR